MGLQKAVSAVWIDDKIKVPFILGTKKPQIFFKNKGQYPKYRAANSPIKNEENRKQINRQFLFFILII